ncbi:MAG: hypothetical protein KDJ52_26220 [Anaerolineae bacterium]|nr:hypothetical protein [Anaerolineae bacterium]
MKKLFICLANSKKYNQRCIAGIELEKSSRKGYRYQIAKRAGNPIWIRPVSDNEHGEVASELVDHINLLDIVEINVTAAPPQSYQSENMLLNNRRLQVVDTINKIETLIDKLLTTDTSTLFGNTGKSVHVDEIENVNHSLVLIKPTNIHVYQKVSFKENRQIRAMFTYDTTRYDLPVTDIDFEEKFNQDPNILQACTHIYFTVSLGIEFNEQHYKLIAGIVYF